MSTTTRARGWRKRLSVLAALSLLAVIPIGLKAQTPAEASATLSNFAGTGLDGYNGDNQAATSAKIWGPTGVAADASGNVFFADRYNHIIRKVDTGNTIRLVAGTPRTAGTPTCNGNNDCGVATSTKLYQPSGVAVAQDGRVFIADTLNNQVEVVNSDGHLWRLMGGLSQPRGLAFDDTAGTLYVADQNHCQVLGYNPNYDDPNNPFDSAVRVIAGNGTCAYSTAGQPAQGDGGQATSATLDYPGAVAVAPGGNQLYIADTSNQRVRVVDLNSGVISTFAGTGSSTSNGDGGQATSAGVTGPDALTTDPAGRVFIGGNDGKVRVVSTAGVISTVYTLPLNPYNGGANPVVGLARDRSGNLYAAGTTSRVYKISGWPGETLNYVALGDSIAAGEGVNYQWSYAQTPNGPDWTSPNPAPVVWEGGSSQLTQDCHRSIYGYPYFIAANKGYRLTDLACTGAGTNNGLMRGQTEGSDGSEPAQISQAFSDTSHEPNVMTLTVGMDDINFAADLNQCYQPALTDCQNQVMGDGNTLDTDVTLAIQTYQSNLDSALLSIQAAANAANVPVPHVYLTGYFDPFHDSYGLSGCRDIYPVRWANAGLSDSEITWIKSQEGTMNSDIQSEANLYSSWVTYVPLSNVMSSHQFCDTQPWVYGASIVAPTGFGGSGDTGNVAPFHSTAQGQSRIATRIMSYMS